MKTPTSAIQDLSGAWTLSDDAGEHSCPMTVPGDGITALHESHSIPEPYWGRNEHRLRWIAERDWTIRRHFDLAQPGVVLAIEGLDTVATVRVNGAEVLRAANAFRTWRVDLSEVARRGLNDIEITFHSAPREAVRLAAAQPFPVPYIAQNNPIRDPRAVEQLTAILDMNEGRALDCLAYKFDIVLRGRRSTFFENRPEGN